jgi:hypothetical protein
MALREGLLGTKPQQDLEAQVFNPGKWIDFYHGELAANAFAPPSCFQGACNG